MHWIKSPKTQKILVNSYFIASVLAFVVGHASSFNIFFGVGLSSWLITFSAAISPTTTMHILVRIVLLFWTVISPILLIIFYILFFKKKYMPLLILMIIDTVFVIIYFIIFSCAPTYYSVTEFFRADAVISSAVCIVALLCRPQSTEDGSQP